MHIGDLWSTEIEGPVIGVEDRVKQCAEKASAVYYWPDGTSIAISECYIGSTDRWSDSTPTIYAERVRLETDDEVSKRVTKRDKQRVRTSKKKDDKEAEERALLKTLQEKYNS